jgi:hypothetical protein
VSARGERTRAELSKIFYCGAPAIPPDALHKVAEQVTAMVSQAFASGETAGRKAMAAEAGCFLSHPMGCLCLICVQISGWDAAAERRRVVQQALDTAARLDGSWVDQEGSRRIAQALRGFAHDVDCQDSTRLAAAGEEEG